MIDMNFEDFKQYYKLGNMNPEHLKSLMKGLDILYLEIGDWDQVISLVHNYFQFADHIFNSLPNDFKNK